MMPRLKRLLPRPLLELKRSVQMRVLRAHFGRLTIAHAFSEIYRKKFWGIDGALPYCSGSGSRGPAVQAYVDFLRIFIERHKIRSIIDLGCGDFVVGGQIAPEVDRYVGVDVVPELIEHLRRTYKARGLEFLCLDITKDELPDADLCLVRQVFKHLSNDEIASALSRRILPGGFKYILVSEHHPSPLRRVVPNKDKPHGPDTRLADDSAVFLDRPPFNLSVQEVLSVPAEPWSVAPGETIRTFLLGR